MRRFDEVLGSRARRCAIALCALAWLGSSASLRADPSPVATSSVEPSTRPAPSAPPIGDIGVALLIPKERAAQLRDRALSETLERQLLEAALEHPASTEQVSSYYQRFRDRFVKPEAISVWRILVNTREQALGLLDQIQNSPTPQKTWSLIAREHSADKATHFRKGNLGFVRADGTTDVPQVRVSPSVFGAAIGLEDGAIGKTPFAEGQYWSLVWRRGFRKEQAASVEQARPEISGQLALAAAREQLQTLLGELRRQHLSEFHPELLESLPAPASAGMPVPHPARQAHPADANPTPRKTDWGDR